MRSCSSVTGKLERVARRLDQAHLVLNPGTLPEEEKESLRVTQ
jgi:hypothetical protein